MASIRSEVNDQAVRHALAALAQRVQNMRPHLMAIGEDITERAKQRFATSTGPDGQRWAPNGTAVLMAAITRIGKSGRKKDGSLNAKGLKTASSKKPLIGPSHDLERQIFPAVQGNSLTVTSSPVYAAIQQFGGKKSEFPHLWGDIPARPFMPIRPDGSLYPAEQALILEQINEYLAGR